MPTLATKYLRLLMFRLATRCNPEDICFRIGRVQRFRQLAARPVLRERLRQEIAMSARFTDPREMPASVTNPAAHERILTSYLP